MQLAYKDELTGLNCCIHWNEWYGLLLGYVEVPTSHPWHGKNYKEIPGKIHGGLTYSGKLNTGNWWIGFDRPCRGNSGSLMEEIENLIQAAKRRGPTVTPEATSMMRKELENLCRQVVAAKESS